MLYVITGEDIATSRKKLTELVENVAEPVYLEGKKASLGEIEIVLKSNALFSEKRAIVIENFTKVKPFEKLTELVLDLQKDQDTIVVLWDEAELSAKNKNAFKGVVSFNFTFPKVYFTFMDGLIPQNSKNSTNLLKDVLKSYEPEQVLYSIIKRIRQLLILKQENFSEFDEFSKMQDWQLSRLKGQANKWSEEQLKNAFLQYSALDLKLKTSGLTMDLSAHLDILLVRDLN